VIKGELHQLFKFKLRIQVRGAEPASLHVIIYSVCKYETLDVYFGKFNEFSHFWKISRNRLAGCS